MLEHEARKTIRHGRLRRDRLQIAEPPAMLTLRRGGWFTRRQSG